MMRQFRKFIITTVVLAEPFALSAQSSDQTPSPVVMQAAQSAFPKQLIYAGGAPVAEGNETNPYHTCAAAFSQNADGTPDLIAAAFSGDGAEIAMLAYAQGIATIISAVTDQQFWLTDGPCELQLVNLADPDHPDSALAKTIDATYDGPDWLFTWDGKTLQNITPLGKEVAPWHGKEVPVAFMNVHDIVDIDHSGALQIISTDGGYDKFPRDDGIMATPTFTLFRYNGSAYAAGKTFQDFGEYEPNLPKSADDLASYKMDTAPWTDAIGMHQTPAPSYQLTIVNGDRDGSNRVTSAKIEIDGVTVIQSTEVNQNVETLTRTVQLQKENKIKVTVDGPAKSHLYVMVE